MDASKPKASPVLPRPEEVILHHVMLQTPEFGRLALIERNREGRPGKYDETTLAVRRTVGRQLESLKPPLPTARREEEILFPYPPTGDACGALTNPL